MRAEYTYDYTDRRISKRVLSKSTAESDGPHTTIYVNSSFKVRDQDQPTKYVFNGSTRVAVITGSLSKNSRIQRLRLYPGWNLLSLAVTVTNILEQFRSSSTDGSDAVLSAAYQWDSTTQGFLPITAAQTLPEGAVIWVKAATNETVSLMGSYTDPILRHMHAAGEYISGAGLESWLPIVPPTDSAWKYDPQVQQWHGQLAGDLAFLSHTTNRLSPGQAVYWNASKPEDLIAPDASLRIRYYHQDHLGSSSVMSDSEGALVEETAFYPFGIPRVEFEPRSIHEPYQFSQKERDLESGLNYFEARYQAGALSRFTSADPKYLHPDSFSGEEIASFLSDPQQLNLYCYARNNPLRYVDPTGLDDKDNEENLSKVEKGNSGVGLAIDLTEHVLEKVGGESGEDLAKWVAKPLGRVAGTGLGVAIHVVQFAEHPTKENAAKFGVFGAKKALLASPFAIVGAILEVEDIFGVGPESILEYNQQIRESEEASREANERTRQAYDSIADSQAKLNALEVQLQAQSDRIEQLQQILDAKEKAAHAPPEPIKTPTRPKLRAEPRLANLIR